MRPPKVPAPTMAEGVGERALALGGERGDGSLSVSLITRQHVKSSCPAGV